MANELITHCGATAPRELFAALGYDVTTPDRDTWSIRDRSYDHERDGMIYAGRNATGTDDWHAVAWAVTEMNRHKEAMTAATAEARHAESIKELAASIRGSADQAMLDRILAGLSERTQYAVKQQLKGRFGL